MSGNVTGIERQCPDNLVVRGQREALTEIERRALDAHLGQCAACRAASALTMLFDAIPATQTGDRDLITRVVDKAVRAPHRFSRWRDLRAAAVVALSVLTCGAAMAAWMAHKQAVDKRRMPRAPSQAATEGAASSRGLALIAPLPSAQEASPIAINEAVPSAEPPRKHRTRAVDPPSTVAEPTAASLFAEANAIRRAGHVRRSITLYQTLRQRFPESSQALLSAISAGDLLLGEGEPGNAVAAYSAYLRGSPNGSLAEEALFGRARGLGLLGRATEEQQTWEELLRRFPHSAYQPAASRRLKELAR